ncbi:hypothetical protein SAMN05444166_5930 [Singulisphaera sp. GP187]|nr:hypothetical protein SAMN05444166_5930 [Singulisphaera sp. GP187]
MDVIGVNDGESLAGNDSSDASSTSSLASNLSRSLWISRGWVSPSSPLGGGKSGENVGSGFFSSFMEASRSWKKSSGADCQNIRIVPCNSCAAEFGSMARLRAVGSSLLAICVVAIGIKGWPKHHGIALKRKGGEVTSPAWPIKRMAVFRFDTVRRSRDGVPDRWPSSGRPGLTGIPTRLESALRIVSFRPIDFYGSFPSTSPLCPSIPIRRSQSIGPCF